MAPSNHLHCSEREAGSWWSCVWCAGVMLAHHKNTSIPVTLDEAHALAQAGGATVGKGSTSAMLVAGLLDRYHIPFVARKGFDNLWADLAPGATAAVLGSMGGFPNGHTLRRWDPAFAGLHAVEVQRVDGQDRVWLDDPLAPILYKNPGGPVSKYEGQWMTKADFKRFVNAAPSLGYVVFDGNQNAPSGDIVSYSVIIDRFPEGPRRFAVKAGATINAYDPAKPGKPVKTLTFPVASSALAVGRASIAQVPATLVPHGSPFLLVKDGSFAGLYVAESQVKLDPAPPPPADLSAALAEAQAALLVSSAARLTAEAALALAAPKAAKLDALGKVIQLVP